MMIRISDYSEISPKVDISEKYKDIKPINKMSDKDADDFWASEFETVHENAEIDPYDKLLSEAFNRSEDELDIEFAIDDKIKALLDRFKPENWAEMDKAQRLSVMKELVKNVGEKLGLEKIPSISFFDEEDGPYGDFDPSSNSINLNRVFHGNDGESEYFDSRDDDSDEDESYEDGSSGGSILGTILGVGLAAYGISKLAKASSSSSYDDDDDDYDDDDEDDDDYEGTRDPNIRKYATWVNPVSEDTTSNEAAYSRENISQTKRQIRKLKWENFKRKVKRFFITVFVCCLFALAAYIGFRYWEYTKGIDVGISSTEAIGVEYSNVQKKLEDAGFTNIRVEAVKDLDVNEQDKENTVASISIDGHDVFADSDKYPYDSRVTIVYHSLKEACPPITAKKAKKMNYLELKELFTDAGFTSIRFEKQEDLITGWINKDGSVESVTINGESDFTDNTSYRIDAEVVIIYHTFSE